MNRSFKNCLITGVTGSGGSYLAEHILNRDKKIKIFGLYRSKGYKNLLEKNNDKRISLFKIDLNNFYNLKKFIKKKSLKLYFT